jgi:putative hydrolase of the HAD superfamily
VDPEETLHVGDSLRDDVEGATKVGMGAVLLDRQGKQADPSIRSINTLAELPRILDLL